MTGRDPFPFGKHKGTALEDIDESYVSWALKQDWFTDPKGRWHTYAAWFKASLTGLDDDLATPIEHENINLERTILSTAPTEFVAFWRRAYGERLRRDGEIQYVAMLRVALTAWQGCEAVLGTKEPAFQTTTEPITLE